jgi:outer membrane protein OmpA-like peptidoglycan-associated protein
MLAVTGVVLCAVSAFALSDVRGSRDHVLFPRPAGYKIVSYGSGDRSVEIPAGDENLLLSGRHVDILYKTEGAPLSPSALSERFVSSLKEAGGAVVFQENPALGGRVVVGRLERAGRDLWVMQDAASLRAFRLLVIETAKDDAFLPAAVVPEAEWETEARVLDLLHLVDRNGRLEFPVKFARGSTIPRKGYESDFKKFVMLMEKDPSLKFRVETWVDAGMKPAEERVLLGGRAAALVDLLVRMGAEAGRLTTAPGNAKESPVPQGRVRLTVVDSTDEGLARQNP